MDSLDGNFGFSCLFIHSCIACAFKYCVEVEIFISFIISNIASISGCSSLNFSRSSAVVFFLYGFIKRFPIPTQAFPNFFSSSFLEFGDGILGVSCLFIHSSILCAFKYCVEVEISISFIIFSTSSISGCSSLKFSLSSSVVFFLYGFIKWLLIEFQALNNFFSSSFLESGDGNLGFSCIFIHSSIASAFFK